MLDMASLMRFSYWCSDVCSSDLGGGGHRPYPLQVVVPAEAVVEAGAGQAVAVRDLDRRHPGLVQGLRDRAHGVESAPVAGGVHAVAQGHVLGVPLSRVVHAVFFCCDSAATRSGSEERAVGEEGG